MIISTWLCQSDINYSNVFVTHVTGDESSTRSWEKPDVPHVQRICQRRIQDLADWGGGRLFF